MTQVPVAGPEAGAPAGAVKPHRGVMILIFGILGIVCCVIFGIVAWVMGNKDLQEMAAGRMDRSGEGLTKAGRICGMVSVGLAILGIVVNIIFYIVTGGFMMMQGMGN